MVPDPKHPITYFIPRQAEKIRNTWDCWRDRINAFPLPVLLVLTTDRVVAIEASDFEGFWDPQPSNYRVVIDRELPDLPPVRCGDAGAGVASLVVAGHTLRAQATVAYAAKDDIEHARVRSIVPTAQDRPGPHEREVIIKEVVKIPCRYCGSLNLQTDKKCSTCGANLG